MTLFEQMLKSFNPQTSEDYHNAVHEIMQQISLAGLARGGFFNYAAFYGGTCLHLFYGLTRFSEDLDFSLTIKNEGFKLEKYFDAIKNEFKLAGREVDISLKQKRIDTNIESAFLKDTTNIAKIGFTTEKHMKIKLEVDIDPPMNFETENLLNMQPYSHWVRCFTKENLFAGKVHAILFRNWQNRVKGRDWYDLEWFIRNKIKLNLSHLETRARQSNPEINLSSKEDFYYLLNERINSVNFELAKKDVLPFIKDTQTLDIWGKDYFIALANQIILNP